MCVIVDACVASLVFSNSSPTFHPIIDWLTNQTKDGVLVYGGKLKVEFYRVGKVRRFIIELSRSGRARLHGDPEVNAEGARVRAKGICRSNDVHIIALARLSGARVLVTTDGDLMQDFKNRDLLRAPRGVIYTKEEHGVLLKHSRACKAGLQR